VNPIAQVNLSCGRLHLSVGGIVVAMEGDKCRDGSFPEEVLPPIPAEELKHATIGEKRAKNLPIEIVRFFRGDNWTGDMLRYAAGKINAANNKQGREE
jgi:hypothetical protein